MKKVRLTCDFLVPAAGLGARMGTGSNKLFLELQGKPILEHTLRAISQLEGVGRMLVMIRPKERAEIEEALAPLGLDSGRLILVEGGPERADSVRNGLKYLIKNPGAPIVMTHDGARPFLSKPIYQSLLKALETHQAAVPALPIAETCRRLAPNGQTSLVDREGLYTTQTPQAFWFSEVHSVFFGELAQVSLTDEAGYFERLGRSLALVPGEPTNIKITRPPDLELAKLFIARPA